MIRGQQKIKKRFVDWKYNLSYLPLAMKMISVIYYNFMLTIFVWYDIKELDLNYFDFRWASDFDSNHYQFSSRNFPYFEQLKYKALLRLLYFIRLLISFIVCTVTPSTCLTVFFVCLSSSSNFPKYFCHITIN